MKTLIFSLFVVSNIVFLVSCKDTSPQPSDLVGNYTVTMSLRDGVVNTEAIKDSIIDAMSKASEELKKARVEMNEDLNLYTFSVNAKQNGNEIKANTLSLGLVSSVSSGENGALLDMGELGLVNLSDIKRVF